MVFKLDAIVADVIRSGSITPPLAALAI